MVWNPKEGDKVVHFTSQFTFVHNPDNPWVKDRLNHMADMGKGHLVPYNPIRHQLCKGCKNA